MLFDGSSVPLLIPLAGYTAPLPASIIMDASAAAMPLDDGTHGAFSLPLLF
jgi:hypothetical protein